MSTHEINEVTVEVIVNVPLEKAWHVWTNPEHIVKWNNATDDWHTPSAENDLQVGGKFIYRMEAKDGSFAFDFEGVYDNIKGQELLAYTIGDGRKVVVTFTGDNNQTTVSETFDAEKTNSVELQKNGWQAILNNFKKYAENVVI